jgi:hypothetical protein
VVGIESCRRGFVDVGAIGEIFGVYRQDLSEGSMAQLNPTSDTDSTAAIDSGA